MDFAKIQEYNTKIENNEPVEMMFRFAGPDTMLTVNTVIAKFLSKMDHTFLLNSMLTILREVVVNALKANAKRVYFAKNNMDISVPEEYEKGMAAFKAEVIGEFDVIEQELKNSDFYIRVKAFIEDGNLKLRVINNATILPKELERIQFRIEKAMQYNDFSDAYAEVDDETEGAGLGIVLTILFLKNMGINPRNFTIQSNGKITVTSLVVPKQLKTPEITTTIKEQIINDIEGVPTFPEHIIELQRLCNDPDSSIELIAHKIEMDPALTTDVIKLSNSAGFITGKKISSVNSAVMTIGLKNVNAILTASNARRILDQRYNHFEEIWEHCNRVAFYAREIAIKYRLTKVVENAYMGGLLHDLGRIVLLATDMELVKRIANIVEDRKIITSTVMEEISIGISHSKIGELIAEKWNFPDHLKQTIRWHHSPLSADKEYRDLVYTIYLANMFCGIEDRMYNYYYIEGNVLQFFKLPKEDDLKKLHDSLKSKYEDQKGLGE